MPKRAKKQISLRGLKAWYGVKVRKRYSRVVRLVRQARSCPSCGSLTLKRMASGIWTCKTCNFTAAGGAYEFQSS
ncbi:MAG: 50S ribosomal protein L37 [Thaumarchaeota archaeon]|nr:50S ribosomal protein L37 [Nitrososphaerota archaeon]